MDVGLLLLRVVVGALFAGHGAQKLWGWSGGPGIEGTSAMFGRLGYRPPRFYAYVGALAEFVGGLMLVLGLGTPFACALVIGQMVNAIVAVHKDNGPWVTNAGYEYPLVIAAVAACLAFTTAGALSLDALSGNEFSDPLWGVGSVGLGIGVAAATLTSRELEEDDVELAHGQADVSTAGSRERERQ